MPGKKRVVIFSVNYTPYVSGAEHFVIEVTGRLAGRYECTVVTAHFDRSLKKLETVQGKRGTYRVIRVGLGHPFIDKFLFVVLAPLVARNLKPDIIHAIMESYAGGALVVYSWISGHSRTLRVLTLQSGEQYSLRKRLKVPWFLRAWIHRVPDKVTAISSFLAEKAREWGARDVVIIPNGVDVQKIQSTVERAPGRVPHRIVCVARLSWEKGLEYLVRALADVRKEFAGAHLVLVGGGALEQKLKDMAKAEGVYNAITFKGALPHEWALQEMAQAEVFVCPSLFEGLGLVFLEAQAVGTPVIGTRVGGIPDVIEDGITGLLVPPKNGKALSEAIIVLFREPKQTRSMAEEAQRRLSRYEWGTIADQVADVYEGRKQEMQNPKLQ